MRFATSAKKTSTAPPLPIIPNRLIKAVMEIRAKDAALNHESHGGRYYFEEMMLAWTAPKKFYVTVRRASWGPRMWPADNHLYFLLAAKDAFRHFGPNEEERWLPETYIYRKGHLETVTMQEMQADIAHEIACRLRRSRPARKPLTMPVLTPMLPAALTTQPSLFSA
jgi:cation diffusion facilitator CzcD-associated flavoprotein CzcO